MLKCDKNVSSTSMLSANGLQSKTGLLKLTCHLQITSGTMMHEHRHVICFEHKGSGPNSHAQGQHPSNVQKEPFCGQQQALTGPVLTTNKTWLFLNQTWLHSREAKQKQIVSLRANHIPSDNAVFQSMLETVPNQNDHNMNSHSAGWCHHFHPNHPRSLFFNTLACKKKKKSCHIATMHSCWILLLSRWCSKFCNWTMIKPDILFRLEHHLSTKWGMDRM